MKKTFTLCIALLVYALNINASVVTITVTSNQFSPANITNVQVGDVVRFSFTQGFHNASSDNVPNGLPAGAARLYSGNPAVTVRTYDYTVTVPGTYRYICEVHGDALSYSGMIGEFTVQSVLPATLTQFAVANSRDNKPIISWNTSTEQNVQYFSVRSSTDGFTFNEIAKVPAAGNSSTEQTYKYTDQNISNHYTYVYYMLATVNKDGKESLSGMKLYKNSLAAASLITKLGPNPITTPSQLMIQFNSERSGQLYASVYDANGKRVIQTQMSAFAGLNNGHLHACHLPPGNYTIAFSLNGLKEVKKLVIK